MSRKRLREETADWLVGTGEALKREQDEALQLNKARRELVAHWAEHPWNYFMGRDLDGTPIWRTKDEVEEDGNPVKPFPDYDYLYYLICDIMKNRLVMIDKARQMIATTIVMGYCDWYASFRTARAILVSKSTQDDAIRLLKDKIRFPRMLQPAWFSAINKLNPMPADRCDYPGTGSYVQACAENIADRDGRGVTASLVVIDEAARQKTFANMMAAALPMNTRVIALTTAERGNAGADAFYEYLERPEDSAIQEGYAGLGL